MKKAKGFTLIELLIVVAIIAILAAIAIPNFLMAQVRSKVARMQSEMQTTATALESYHVDNNSYPEYKSPFDGADHHVPILLTTPVAYLSTIGQDIFFNGEPEWETNSLPDETPSLHYLTEDYSPGLVKARLDIQGIHSLSVNWLVWSGGPDRKDDEGSLRYDPTNGTVSNGDIIRFGP